MFVDGFHIQNELATEVSMAKGWDNIILFNFLNSSHSSKGYFGIYRAFMNKISSFHYTFKKLAYYFQDKQIFSSESIFIFKQNNTQKPQLYQRTPKSRWSDPNLSQKSLCTGKLLFSHYTPPSKEPKKKEGKNNYCTITRR